MDCDRKHARYSRPLLSGWTSVWTVLVLHARGNRTFEDAWITLGGSVADTGASPVSGLCGIAAAMQAVPRPLAVVSTHVNDMPRTGDDVRDFHSGCVAIQNAVKAAIAQANIPVKDVRVSWAEPYSGPPVPQVANITVTVNGRTATLEVTRKRVLDSYEKVGDPELLRAIREMAYNLTRGDSA